MGRVIVAPAGVALPGCGKEIVVFHPITVSVREVFSTLSRVSVWDLLAVCGASR